jgi:hypothetical protein
VDEFGDNTALGCSNLRRRKMFKSAISVAAITMFLFVITDVLIMRWMFGLGLPYDEAEHLQRAPAPYIYFKGAPNALDHDQWGYRWVPQRVDTAALKVAFFGGSTGYWGNPPIARLLQDRLSERLSRSVAVANFSVVSSNHRMHLHNIIESRSMFLPDLIIFYGGYNETLLAAHYDPRPGYPFNYFFRDETDPFWKVLFRYSAIIGLLEGVYKRFTPFTRLYDEYKPLSPDWNMAIVDKYIETLTLAKSVAEGFPSERCGSAKFLAFYQPFNVDGQFKAAHAELRIRLSTSNLGIDVSDAFDHFGKEVWYDAAHVRQPANEKMAEIIADAIIEQATIKLCE